ncbi:thioredoxin family protein [Agrococcus baldri]|uniref:Thioredoxin-2 n=1 Tax=Agrococcus baldri TaxID=153730 RepID=A0AA87RF63_9MICO|nr:thioredoxin family protein [Agrococcus baldri]GEK79345.1 putative thioredoxin-2 [Agrococcus baldri]
MTTHDITIDTIDTTIAGGGIVLLDFWAAWCGPCRRFAPVFEGAAAANPDIAFGKVDTEDQQQLAAAFRITSIPTLMAFRDGILIFSQPGALGPAQLDSLIAGIRALDMDDVRRQVARQRAIRDAS